MPNSPHRIRTRCAPKPTESSTSNSHGGKDGTPYPVDRETYGVPIEVLRKALSSAKMGAGDRSRAFRRLSAFEKEAAGRQRGPAAASRAGPRKRAEQDKMGFALDRTSGSAYTKADSLS